jgi:DNA-dependent RNA polymerase auxiliary subunit epsilon
MSKFGRNIELTGTSEFREKVVELVIKNNYKVEFLDEFSKQHHDKVLEPIKVAENNIDDDNDFSL